MSIGKIIAIVGLVFCAVLILLQAVGSLVAIPAWVILALIGGAFSAVLFG